MLGPLPAIDGPTLVKIQNAGFGSAVARILSTMLPTERKAARDLFLAGAVAKAEGRGAGLHPLALAIHGRCVILAKFVSPYLDTGLYDGQIGAALLCNGGRAPCFSTVRTAVKGALRASP